MMRYLIPVLLIICFAAGCMETNEKSVMVGTILTDRHLGWGTEDCVACHATYTFMDVSDTAAAVHKILRQPDGTVYYDGCRSCHGGNGKPIDNTMLANCTLCHNAETKFIVGNERFAKTHSKSMNLTTAAVNCKACHNVAVHPQRATTLYEMSNATCLDCHTEHGDGPLCSNCHTQDNGKFARGTLGIIETHKISIK